MLRQPVSVACGDEDHVGGDRAVWSNCACGSRICHDSVMEANILKQYPGAKITFECMACTASRVASKRLDPAKMIEATRSVLPPETADLPIPRAAFQDYLKKFRRN
jgi:hypothetical protein